MIYPEVKVALSEAGWFQREGSYVLVDGQFGSTGKGLMADVLAQYSMKTGYTPSIVTTNAGCNSGHTAIMEDGHKIMTQQIPVLSAVLARLTGHYPETHLNGGAVLDMAQVHKEVEKYGVYPFVHESAAIIHPDLIKAFNSGSMDAIASTGKGVGQAMAAKVLRQPYTPGTISEDAARRDTKAMEASYAGYFEGLSFYNRVPDYAGQKVFVETAQGFSLGINSGFYPYTTSRECSVPQALADAGLSHRSVRNVVMCVRTFPIRVGNTSMGNSGPCYEDQREIKWEDLGVEPELTTVTKRVRRLFTWSNIPFAEALRVNEPDCLFCNFCNYLKPIEQHRHVDRMRQVYKATLGYPLKTLLLGFGPKASDVRVDFA